MIDLHVGFTGGELGGNRQPSYLRAGVRHLQAIGYLVRGKLRHAARAEREAVRDLTDQLRLQLNRFLSSDRQTHPLPIRVAQRVLSAANDLLGEPICSEVELDQRRGQRGTRAEAKREAAPVFVYVTWDSADRAPIEQLLKSRGIAYRVLDVGRDETMLSFIRTKARCEPPVVFVGDQPVGGIDALKAADASGELVRLLAGSA